MLTFKQWLDEAYEFEHEVGGARSQYGFKDHKGTPYKVFIEKSDHHNGHDVLFANKSEGGHYRFNQTHDQGSHARHIFSTVHNILKHHANANPDVKRYVFTSDKAKKGPLDMRTDRPEGSRNKLYRHMTDKLGGYSRDNGNEVEHHIPAHNLRD